MRAVDIIRKKRDGEALTRGEIEWFVQANLRGEAPDYQLAALLMAIFQRGLNHAEVGCLTRAFMESGDILDLSPIPKPKVDKHSTGGVGDKVSLILAPLVACEGVGVPMISGRGLGHTGGTLDKLEAIPGYNPFLSTDQFARVVETEGCCIIGQTDRLCPADRKWYATRDATSTVESIPLITASIISKKLAEGIDALLLDVKVGSGAFMPTMEKAVALAESLVGVGREMGKPTRALLTDMSQPLGREIGNACEVVESVEILQNRGDGRLTELCVVLGAHMLDLAGVEPNLEKGAERLRGRLADGRAFERFVAMVTAQGGDPATVEHPERLPRAKLQREFLAPAAGWIAAMQTDEIGRAAMALGAGRERAEDQIDFGAGLTMLRRVGDRVARGEPLCSLRANDEARLAAGLARLAGTISIAETAPAPIPLVRQVIA